MSNDLVTTGGGGVVVPAGGVATAGEYVGDMSVDSGGAPGAVATPEVLRGLSNAVGFDLTPEQIQKAFDVLHRDRAVMDERQKHAAIVKLRAEWGAAGYDKRLRSIVDWLEMLPGDLGEGILNARDGMGDVLCSKPAVLRAMSEVAAATFLTSDDKRDAAAAEQAIRAEWKSAYHSHIATINRYLDTVPQSVREGLLSARDDNGVATMNDPQALRWLLQLARPRLDLAPRVAAPDRTAINSARLREIEGWMSTRDARYWKDEAVQVEYRELLDQGATGDAVPHTADSELARRITEIENWMGARRGSSEYKRYWDDAAVQREYGELLGRRDQLKRQQ